jgi:hypothetical protein
MDLARISKELEPLAKEELEFSYESFKLQTYEDFRISMDAMNIFMDLFGDQFEFEVIKE